MRVVPSERRYANLSYLLPFYLGQRSKPGVSALGSATLFILPQLKYLAMQPIGGGRYNLARVVAPLFLDPNVAIFHMISGMVLEINGTRGRAFILTAGRVVG